MIEINYSIGLNDIDSTAASIANLIDKYTSAHNIDRDNLVIMMGESHNSVGHKLFHTRFMMYMNTHMPLSGYFVERPHIFNDVIRDAHNNKQINGINSIDDAAVLASAMNSNFNGMIDIAESYKQNIGVTFMDMPYVYDMSSNHPKRFCEALEPDVLDRVDLTRIGDADFVKQIISKEKYEITDPVSTQRRDLFMRHQILQHKGPMICSNGAAHIIREDQATLAQHLVDAGKNVIPVIASIEGFRDYHFADLPRPSVSLMFDVAMKDVTAFYDIDSAIHQWRAMNELNGLKI